VVHGMPKDKDGEESEDYHKAIRIDCGSVRYQMKTEARTSALTEVIAHATYYMQMISLLVSSKVCV
jgi:hypothetical protein